MLGGDRKRKNMAKLVIGDADSIIALVYKDDSNHTKARKISEQLLSKNYQIIYPDTAIIEAITTLRRALNLADKAHFINKQYQKGTFHVEYITKEIMQRASEIFEETISKQNTLFDAIVAASAEKLEADSIFSFDNWYPKLGFKLAGTKYSIWEVFDSEGGVLRTQTRMSGSDTPFTPTD